MVTLVSNHTMATIQQQQSNNSNSNTKPLKVTFENGAECQADLVIGADGIHSKVRSFVLQQNGHAQVSPRYCQYVTWRGILEYNLNEAAFETWGAQKVCNVSCKVLSS